MKEARQRPPRRHTEGGGASSRRMEVHNLGAPVKGARGGAGEISKGGVTGAPPGRCSKSNSTAADGRKQLGACPSKIMWLGVRRGSNGPEAHGEENRIYKSDWARIRQWKGSVANLPPEDDRRKVRGTCQPRRF